jgi:oxalate---CoA ligase
VPTLDSDVDSPRSGPLPNTVWELLAAQAAARPNAPALVAPGREPLSYADLLARVGYVCDVLHAYGVDRRDRVATLLPSGADAAVAFLGVAASACCTPLDPDARPFELSTQLARLRTKALIATPGAIDDDVMARLNELGLRVITLTSTPFGAAGDFELRCPAGRVEHPPERPNQDDLALIVTTSGTTSVPKFVPFSHGYLLRRTASLCAAYEFTEDDRNLVVMPLHLTFGIVSGLLTILYGGGTAICSSRFEAATTLAMLKDYRPSTVGASGGMLRELLAVAERQASLPYGLRQVIHGSSPLFSSEHDEIERVFRARVLCVYSMTEASPIAVTPAAPRKHKPGSVGMLATPDVAFLDNSGRQLKIGTTGEIAVRGATVFDGYFDDPAANAQAFLDGWFKTGDLGYLDDDGYLFLVGRVKEAINRGGAKVAPAEVDEVLCNHPSIADVVTFAIPHSRLGEDVAVAVVLRKGAAMTQSEVRQYAAARLAPHKVPHLVEFVESIPKGANGKPRRRQMAEILGLSDHSASPSPLTRAEPPDDTLEAMVLRHWREAFATEAIGATDDFFALGGDSLLAARMVTAVGADLGRTIPMSILLQAPTVSEMADLLRRDGWRTQPTSAVRVNAGDLTRLPLFWCSHVGQGQAMIARRLLPGLDPTLPLWALESSGQAEDGSSFVSVVEVADAYARQIVRVQPTGPYRLIGYSLGGVLAFETARIIRASGADVEYLGLVDTACPSELERLRDRVLRHVLTLATTRPSGWREYLAPRARLEWERLRTTPIARRIIGEPIRSISPMADLIKASHLVRSNYRPTLCDFRATLYLADDQPRFRRTTPQLGWRNYVLELDIVPVAGDHASLLQTADALPLATHIDQALSALDGITPTATIATHT